MPRFSHVKIKCQQEILKQHNGFKFLSMGDDDLVAIGCLIFALLHSSNKKSKLKGLNYLVLSKNIIFID